MSLSVADYLFILLTLIVVAVGLRGIGWALHRANGSAPQQIRDRRFALLAATGWLLLTAALAASGFLHQWAARPPHLLLVLLPPMVLTAFLLRSRRVGALLDALPVAAFVAPQVFRVAVEVLLWLLYRDGRLPVQMTFEGRNFDVLAGLTALPVAWWLSRHPSSTLARVWHVVGLLLLANIVSIALLSAPTPFRQFWNEPANTIIAEFPWVWLPGGLVPVAYILHLLGLRQLLRRGKTA